MHIDNTTHKIDINNYYKTKNKKTQIVIASSLRKNNFHINRYMYKNFGNSKEWCTYSIDRNGNIFEHFNPKYYADFLGVNLIDKQSISIVLENMGSLTFNSSGEYTNWINEVCRKENVAIKNWIGQKYWEIYSDTQIISCINLCSRLCDDFKIPKILIDFKQYNKDAYKFNGITFRSNHVEDTNDINPLLNINQLKQLIEI